MKYSIALKLTEVVEQHTNVVLEIDDPEINISHRELKKLILEAYDSGELNSELFEKMISKAKNFEIELEGLGNVDLFKTYLKTKIKPHRNYREIILDGKENSKSKSISVTEIS